MDIPQKLPLDQVVTDPNIEKIKARLLLYFKPTRFFLFGSRTAGTHRSDSDYDIVLVVPDTFKKSRIENMQKASELLFDLDVSADVFVYSEEHFEDWKNELNSIPETAFNLGVEIPLG